MVVADEMGSVGALGLSESWSCGPTRFGPLGLLSPAAQLTGLRPVL
jgi:hypothetical protein